MARPDLSAALRDLADHADTLEPAELAGALETMKVQIILMNTTSAPMPNEEDRLLEIDAAAARLATTPDWLRRHPELPFRIELSPGQVRFSSKGIDRWIATRRTR